MSQRFQGRNRRIVARGAIALGLLAAFALVLAFPSRAIPVISIAFVAALAIGVVIRLGTATRGTRMRSTLGPFVGALDSYEQNYIGRRSAAATIDESLREDSATEHSHSTSGTP
jgi:hypothetical protein